MAGGGSRIIALHVMQRLCQSWDLRGLGSGASSAGRTGGRSHGAEELLVFDSQHSDPWSWVEDKKLHVPLKGLSRPSSGGGA